MTRLPYKPAVSIRYLSPTERRAWAALDLPGADLALNGRDWQLVRSVARAIEQAEKDTALAFASVMRRETETFLHTVHMLAPPKHAKQPSHRYKVCPACGGDKKKTGSDCTLCHGKGWVPTEKRR